MRGGCRRCRRASGKQRLRLARRDEASFGIDRETLDFIVDTQIIRCRRRLNRQRTNGSPRSDLPCQSRRCRALCHRAATGWY